MSQMIDEIMDKCLTDKPIDIDVKIDAFFDARAMACPMPLLKAKLSLRALAEGQSLYLLAGDKNSQTDLVAFCQKNGHQVHTWISQDTRNLATIYCFLITKSVQKN